MKIAILGRLPQLSLAELLSLYGNKVSPLGQAAALIDQPQIELSRLGGSMKIVELKSTLSTVSWDDISNHLQTADWLRSYLERRDFGLSLYGRRLGDQDLFKTALSMKKHWAKAGLRLRTIKSDGGALSAAQLLHHRLIENGADIAIVIANQKTYIGITEAVQDIQSYGERDYGRPSRDPKVGMLPPKLAQIMINLAAPKAGGRILDPFCGTGVVLQEALLLGHHVIGSDIEPRLIAASKANLDWLAQGHQLPTVELITGDACSMKWAGPIDAVVTEGYLGPPLKAKSIKLSLDFLSNLAPQLSPGTPVVLSLPAWRNASGTLEHLEIIDRIKQLRYTLKQFPPVRQSDMTYQRPTQLVARDIIALEKV
jgi:tRNA G10  N-methylase Trm11